MSELPSKTTPFSIRLSEAERSDLTSRANGLPLGTYAKSILFPDRPQTPRQKAQRPSQERQDLSRVLAYLGGSRLASNFNQIAKAANQGALPVTAELEAELKAACDHIREMRDELLAALGVTRTLESPPGKAAAPAFNRVAAVGLQ